MKTQWQPLIKPSLLHAITALPDKEALQILSKIDLLTQNPLPDGKQKKQLKHVGEKLYRVRSGDYRIFYTFDQQCVRVLTIRRRDEDTYDSAPNIDDDSDVLAYLAQEPTDLADVAPAGPHQPDWERIFAQTTSKPLPEPITVELLNKLGVPPHYHQRLLPIKTQDELLCCPGIADDVLLQIDQYMFETPLSHAMQQPDLVLNAVDDLLRYKEGELLAFLLKLSPEQEKYTRWSLQASGPMLVKGGPGTGKSTVALYRIRSLLEQWQQASKPHILFATYSNALIKSSEQLLQQLLGKDAQCVRVQTADKLAYDILHQSGQVKEITDASELQSLTRQAAAETQPEGNLLQQQAQKQTLERMGYDYLLQELNSVIVARQLSSLGEYLATSRSGRKLRLNATQRRYIWRIYQRWSELLLAAGKETWQQRRARVEELAEQSFLFHYYDAVVIDEAQDLDPSLLRLLIKLCKTSNRIFVTADANQSIYGSGFTWSDVHQSLKFQGRTSILRANYRSTGEIGEAAYSYLTYGVLEPEVSERIYVNNGPLPDVRTVLNSHYEAQLLASFFRKASLNFRLTIGSCAVLCPDRYAGKAIAAALNEQGIEATYMTGQDLNLTRPGVKVLTLNASKGLEFPIVALAGFTSSNYPIIPPQASNEERDELLARERRTLYVGMTRAMRALLIVLPPDPQTPLLQGFDPTCWNFSGRI